LKEEEDRKRPNLEASKRKRDEKEAKKKDHAEKEKQRIAAQLQKIIDAENRLHEKQKRVASIKAKKEKGPFEKVNQKLPKKIKNVNGKLIKLANKLEACTNRKYTKKVI
jgi:hypothetical protein